MKGVLTFIIVFSVVVIFHEFGHFFFARRAGILVREFSIGMGPKIFGHQSKDGTLIPCVCCQSGATCAWPG